MRMLSRTKDFKPNQIKVINDIYEIGKENNVLVIPVGLAFDSAYREIQNKTSQRR